MVKYNPFWIVLLLLFGASCTFSKKTASVEPKQKSYQFPYDLEKPDVTFELPKILVEISGIALSPDKKEIIAIQDENGILFYIDNETGEVLRQQKFHKDGDYEDIEVVQNTIYIMKSNGSLYELNNSADTLQRTKYKVGYHKEHDMEGLCLDKKNNRLLIACKGELSKDVAYNLHKGLYAFDLDSKMLGDKPSFSISLNAIENYIKEKGSPVMKAQFEKIMQTNDGLLGFAPSAVAIHPITENIYISSSKGKALIVISQENEVVYMQKLNKKVHEQPEGMLFDSDGTLYISNEGKEGKAKIYKFRPR